MKILVGWDRSDEAELLQMYLGLEGEHRIEIVDQIDALVPLALSQPWDILFMAQTFPTVDDSLRVFSQIRKDRPEIPIVLGTRQDEMIGLPGFLKQGLRSYVIRDERGDWMFFVLTALESTIAAVQAERTSVLAERLREELDGVRKLQETIIPRGIPTQKGYRTVARYEPSEVNIQGGKPVVMAGGDYYEVFPIDESSLIALVGDASGHGLKACMAIITMHTLIRMINNEGYQNTSAFVTSINERLCENVVVQSDGGFITLFYAAIDTQNHRLQWTSAGHPPALIHDRRTNEVYCVGSVDQGGLPLAITSALGYESHAVNLPPDCRVLIFSDGLTDALSPNGGTETEEVMFGIEGITATLKKCRDLTIEETMQALFNDSRDFTQGEGRHDDTSIVLIERY
jgi:phosphoserine phosphatase RsbU/P